MKSFVSSLAALPAGLLLLTGIAPATATEQMILDKPYSVTPGSEPGSFICKWGDESVEWKPQAWQPSDYQEIGPAIYDRWTQPGLPYPWEKPLEERVKQDGREVHDRSYTALYFNEFGENYITEWSIDLTSPDGTQRNKKLFEWMVSYRLNKTGLPSALVDKVRAQYMFTFVAPNDYRGLGIATTIYHGEKFNDEFLYTPAARRTRRLPQAARQDIVPGTIVRWEDFPQVKPFPDIEYKVVGHVLYAGQPAGSMGFASETEGEKINIGLDGVCEPSVILELTPTSKSYWYAKQRRIVGIKTGSSWYEEVFDANGEITRKRVNRRAVANTDPRLQNANQQLEDWQMIWAGEFFFEPKSGFRQDWYMNKFWVNYDKMPRDAVNVENLSKEPVRKILFWD
jgi:hypothetical protein